MSILLAIIALIAGYFFIKNFDAVENYFFHDKNDKGFSTPEILLFISIGMGALTGIYSVLGKWFDFVENPIDGYSTGGAVYLCVICMGIYYSFLKYQTVTSICTRSIFIVLSCTIGFYIGFAGSLIVIGLLLLILALYVFAAMFGGGSSGSGKKTIVDGNGEEHELSRGMLGEEMDEKGDTWTRSGIIGDDYMRDDA